MYRIVLVMDAEEWMAGKQSSFLEVVGVVRRSGIL